MKSEEMNFDYVINNLEFIQGCGKSGSNYDITTHNAIYFDPKTCKYYHVYYTLNNQKGNFLRKRFVETELTVELIRLRIDRYARKDTFYTKGMEGFPLSEKEAQILFADNPLWFYEFYWKYHFRPMKTETTEFPMEDIYHYCQEEVWK